MYELRPPRLYVLPRLTYPGTAGQLHTFLDPRPVQQRGRNCSMPSPLHGSAAGGGGGGGSEVAIVKTPELEGYAQGPDDDNNALANPRPGAPLCAKVGWTRLVFRFHDLAQ